jgi:hypothetical protein
MASVHTAPRKRAAPKKKVPVPVEYAASRPVLGLVDKALRMTERVALRIVQLSRTARRRLHASTPTPAKRIPRRVA